MNYRRIIHVVGCLLAVISTTLCIPLAVAFHYGESTAVNAFLKSIAIGLSAGVIAILAGRRSRTAKLYRGDAILIVGISWAICAVVGCLPYIFSGMIPSIVDAYFETVSGFTTTGASILTDVENIGGSPTPRSLLFWRCMTNWLGGVGIIVLFVALLPAIGVGGRLLFHLEVPGVGEKGFMPHIRQTAVILWVIYLIMTAAEVIALHLAGVEWFYAVCHSFSTVATGGFSPHNASIGHYDSGLVQVIVTFFMFLAGVNFTLYVKLRANRWKALLSDTELRIYMGILLVGITAVTVNLVATDTVEGVGDAIRTATFQVVSIGTTTGFATDDFARWPEFSRVLLVLLMFVGGCAGSTAGGMKVVRIALVFKFMLRRLALHVRPRSVEQISLGGRVIDQEVVQSVIGMFLLFIACFVLGSLGLAAMGQDLLTAMTASIAALGNIGPGLGSVGPTCNYSEIPAQGKMLLALLMLVGRLEVFTILGLFLPSLWRD